MKIYANTNHIFLFYFEREDDGRSDSYWDNKFDNFAAERYICFLQIEINDVGTITVPVKDTAIVIVLRSPRFTDARYDSHRTRFIVRISLC